MEVIVKSSPKIEIELATKVVKVGGKVTVDSALSTESENPVQNKVITEELGKKATKEGNYPSLRVGTADTAIDLAGRGESVPASFGFRASGGKSIKDGRAYIKRIKGNSVVWNQLVPSFETNKWYISPTLAEKEFINNGVRLTFNIDQDSAPANGVAIIMIGTSSSFANHAYLTMAEFKPSRTISVSARNFHSPWGGAHHTTAEEGKWTTLAYIYTPTTDYEGHFVLGTEHGTDVIKGETLEIRNARVIDLTQMFQAGNEPTTIEDFNARVATLCIDLNAYNEGEVIHCNTESIKSVGDNAWDEEWEVGSMGDNNGNLISSSNTIRSKNYIKAIGGNEYYFGYFGNAVTWGRVHYYDAEKNWIGSIAKTVDASSFIPPLNCAYMKFRMGDGYGTTYNHDITISLYHSGWKAEVDNTYKPYWQDTLPLPIISKYFPDGMKSAGSAHDEIRYNKASGKWEYSKGKINSVDLGTLNWDKTWYTENGKWRIFANLPSKVKGQNNVLTKKYVTAYKANSDMPDISITGNNQFLVIYIRDTSYSAQGVDALIASLQGVILYYESNDWEWVELDAEDQNFRDYYNVADFGTEMSQSSVPSANFSADIIYQFNAVDMIREHEIEITELQSVITEQQSVIATMQAQLTSLINGGQ